MMEEIWQDVEEYEGIYQVSNLGRVRSLDREVVNGPGSTRLVRGRVLKSWANRGGYLSVTLTSDDRPRKIGIHRLVARQFLGPVPVGYECNHIDGDKTNNRLDNLEWVTRSENIRHACENGLIKHAGLSPEIAEMIRQVYDLGQHTQEQIGSMFGVNQQMISAIVRGESWNW